MSSPSHTAPPLRSSERTPSRIIVVLVLVAVLGMGALAWPARTATASEPHVQAGTDAWPSPARLSVGELMGQITRWLLDGVGKSTAEPGVDDDGGATERQTLSPPPARGPFRMNLYRKGDFVHQQTVYWCVAASAQTMMNIIDEGKPDRSARTQRRLHFQARNLDREGDEYWKELHGPARWKRGLHGLGLTDWADLLTVNGYGPYEVTRAPSLQRAIRMAARAIRLTGRPAGLVVWRGAHAWVMSGFTASADPAYTDRFKVRKVFIQDPWYPDVSSIWGRSRPPGSAVAVRALHEDFLRYDRPGRRHPMRDGKYMLVLPTLPVG